MRAAIPYLMVAGCLVAMVWAVSFGTLPPADFTFSNLGEIKTVDLALVTGQPEGRVVWALFEGLCRWDPETLEPKGGVAEDWDLSDDKRTYTFHLRTDALWSDGTPVLSEDFVWSLRRVLHPETAAEYAYELWYVAGAEKFNAGKIEPGDPVQIELDRKRPGARPFASGIILRGTLLEVRGPNGHPEATNEAAAKEKADTTGEAQGETIYVVEIDGRRRAFQKGAAEPGRENYRWILYDFRSVGIRALDSRTLEIRLNHPVPYFPQLMGFYPFSPVNRKCVETYGYPRWTKPENIVSNGPFLLKSRRIRDRIRLVRNPAYWDLDNVKLNVVDVLAVESYPTNLNLYLTGQVDWIPAVPVEVVPDLLKRKQGDFKPAPYLASYHYLVNTRKPPLDDVRVRRALAMAIDKRQIVQKVTRAGQIPTRSIVPSNIRDYLDYSPVEGDRYDVEKARALLAEAGYPAGRRFPKIEILYNTSEAHQAIAELIQSQWKRSLGIDVALRNQEWAAYLNSRRQGDFDFARAGWIADYIDPSTFLNLFKSDSPINHTGWADPEYDRLLELAKVEADDARRLAYYHQAERILMDQMPVIPLYEYVSQSMVRPYVKGFYHNIQDVHPLRDIWIDAEEKRRVLQAEGLW